MPVAACDVRIALPPGTRASATTTDINGVYEFAGIAEGTYAMGVECPGYLWACTSAGGPCPNITVFKDQRRSNVDFTVPRAATVRGRVVDSEGRPVARASVRAGSQMLGNSLIRGQSSITRDDGSFEIGGLVAGSLAFEVEVPPAAGALRSPLVYYPGVLKPEEATVVDVTAGAVTENVIITVPPILDRTLTVRVPPPDATMNDVVVSLIRTTPLMTRRLELDSEGKAIVTGLVDGRYLLAATATSAQDKWFDYQTLDFIADSLDVALQLRQSGTIRGRIVAEPGGVPQLLDASVGAAWVEDGVTLNPVTPEEASIAADGTFEIAGVFGRRVLQLVRFDSSWKIHSVLQGRTDVTESGIDITPGATSEVTIVVRRR
jgi:hypothetical protein